MKFLIADDHDLLRDTLALFLRQDTALTVDTAPDYDCAHRMILQHGPYDLVLLDHAMPGMNGLQGLCDALDANGGRVALISGALRPGLAEQAMGLGASGVLSKTLSASHLGQALRKMAIGTTLPEIQGETPGSDFAKALTPRELQVIEAFCQGLSNREIAAQLQLSEPTIKLHAKTLCRKIGASNRTQAAMIARTAGLF